MIEGRAFGLEPCDGVLRLPLTLDQTAVGAGAFRCLEQLVEDAFDTRTLSSQRPVESLDAIRALLFGTIMLRTGGFEASAESLGIQQSVAHHLPHGRLDVLGTNITHCTDRSSIAEQGFGRSVGSDSVGI